jgi:predicted short-subunit dehydrogenase-like oxidoreductase (DUF2520 family)
VADSLSILASAGVDEPARLIAPLLSATLDNALRLGDNALTGPVQRADVTTVQAHIRALAGSEYVDSYLAMAIRTMQRAQAAGRLTSQQCDDLIEGIRIAQEESE